MKRVLFTVCILFCMSSPAMADDLAMAESISATPEMVLGGEIKSVSWADPVKGTKSEIVVTDAAKKDVHVLITATTTLWDSDAKAVMSDEIIPKVRVNVIYFTTEEGINIGKSIKILK